MEKRFKALVFGCPEGHYFDYQVVKLALQYFIDRGCQFDYQYVYPLSEFNDITRFRGEPFDIIFIDLTPSNAEHVFKFFGSLADAQKKKAILHGEDFYGLAVNKEQRALELKMKECPSFGLHVEQENDWLNIAKVLRIGV